MCGIAGIIGHDVESHADAVASMLEAMAHRGPNGAGVWVAPSGHCVLGHRRLAILDLTSGAAQPMVSEGNEVALSYNGEVYNFAELRQSIHVPNEIWRSTGDTEVVLKMLARRGPESLEKMNGMFSLALWNDSTRQLLLARDRFGQKPLYWARYGNGLIFASEIRALLASGLLPRNISRQGMLSFLCHGSVQGPETIVDDVWLLPRASTLTIRAGESPQIRPYWRPPQSKRAISLNEVRTTFVEATRNHLVSDVPVGVFLSGGVDSSVVAAACREAGCEVTSLSVVFPDDRSHCEGKFAIRAAKQSKTRHVEVPVGHKEALDFANQSLLSLDQPSIDGVNTFIVSQAARQIGLTVALSGLGGDELFGGYTSFENVRRWAHFRRWGGGCLSPVANTMDRWQFWDRRWSKAADLLAAGPGIVPAYLNFRRLFCSRQVQAIAPHLCPAGGWQSGISERRDAELASLTANLHPFDAMAQLELDVYMGQTLLRDTDVMGMANSLEIRVPFLDTNFSDLALSLPTSARSPRPQRKWLLIEAFSDCLPRENWRRPKRGFSLPWDQWILGSLRSRIEEGLASLAELSGVVSGATIRELWHQFTLSPSRVGWSRVWALFVLGEYISRHKLRFRDSTANLVHGRT